MRLSRRQLEIGVIEIVIAAFWGGGWFLGTQRSYKLVIAAAFLVLAARQLLAFRRQRQVEVSAS